MRNQGAPFKWTTDMPYSITTRDGITINNIPDDVPADAPELKSRVASIRVQGGTQNQSAVQAAPKEPNPTVLPDVNMRKSGFAMGLMDPIDAGAQLLERSLPDSWATNLNKSTNWLREHVPGGKHIFAQVEESPRGTSKLVQALNEQYDKQRTQGAQGVSNLVTGQPADPGYDWGRLAGNIINPTNLALPGSGAASGVGQIALQGAKAGLVSGLLQPVTGDAASGSAGDFWKQKAIQGGVGAISGGLAAPAISKVGQVATQGVASVKSRLARSARSPADVNVSVQNVLRAESLAPADVPDAIMQSVRTQVESALKNGQKVDPGSIVRTARAQAVGLTGDSALTAGQASRNPIQWAQEQNLSGVTLNTPQGKGNPLATRFQNQAQALKQVFDKAGASQATDRVTAGQTLMDALRAADDPVKAAVDGAYQNARSMAGGRVAELERGAFSQAANKALDDGMWGRFVPPEIRGMLNDITTGKTPFNVESAVQIDGILSAAQRKAARGGDSAGESAIGVIRNALHNTPLSEVPAAAPAAKAAAAAPGEVVAEAAMTHPNGVTDVPFREVTAGALPAPVGSDLVAEAAPSMTAAGQPANAVALAGTQKGAQQSEGQMARDAFDQARKAARNRFATIDDTPALKAALDNEAPDKFVQNYIIGANVRDVQAMKNVLSNSPGALAQARAQIADHLKRAAFGNDASGDAGFSSARYLNTLRHIGRQKLETFFRPDEVVSLNLVGQVGSDLTSVPAGAARAVNYSNTGSAVMNMLSRISESPLMRKPGLRIIANQIGEARTEGMIRRALAAQPANQPAELSPEAMRAVQALFPLLRDAGGIAGGAIGGQAAQ